MHVCVCVLVMEGRVHGNSMPFFQFFSKANASLKNFLLKKNGTCNTTTVLTL